MLGLVYIDSIESFYDTKFVEWVRHVALNFLLVVSGYVGGGGTDEKVVYLSEDEYQSVSRVCSPVEAWFVSSMVESHRVEEYGLDVQVPEAGSFWMTLKVLENWEDVAIGD